MVQFGGGLPSGGSMSGGRNQAFRFMRLSRFNMRNVFLLLLTFLVLRNLLQNDYQKEEIKYLRNSGMSEEQIQRYIPKTAVEHEQDDELENMKRDIAYLLKEVENLKARLRSSEEKAHEIERNESLRTIDGMHEEKRRKKEEQLLKDHPNFKPSKRLNDLMLQPQHESKME
jgi:DNA-binding transcriptional MerR regulator